MNSTIKNVFVFAAGATIGSIVTWKVLNVKYEQRVQEEIDSVKDVYSRRYIGKQQSSDDDTEITEMTEQEYEEAVEEYKDRIRESGYINYSSVNDDKKGNHVFDNRPRVISPDEFDDIEDYEHICLTYYSDGILTDDNDMVMPNADDVVGLESLKHFGEYEADTVYVRNDTLKCKYEICLDYGNYSDVLKRKPYLAED